MSISCKWKQIQCATWSHDKNERGLEFEERADLFVKHNKNWVAEFKMYGARKFRCYNCGCKFCTVSKLINHQIEVHKLKVEHVACNQCNYKAYGESYLSFHMRIHSKYYLHTCPHCRYRLSTKAALKLHCLKYHSSERLFQCDECRYRFDNIEQLNTHKSGYTGEKIFLCYTCQCRFKFGKLLASHMKGHMGEKTETSFGCVGAERFSSKIALKPHQSMPDLDRSSKDEFEFDADNPKLKKMLSKIMYWK